ALAKVRLLADIDDALDRGELAALDRLHLRQYLGLDPLRPVTLAALQADIVPGIFSVRQFALGGHAHLLLLQARDRRLVLYTPTALHPLKGFADHQSLLAWIHEQLASATALEWVKALYRVDLRTSTEMLQSELDYLRQRSGTAEAPRWPFGTGTLLSQDLFLALKAW
ncbi:dermonecrotic toxin domain-containing protein, partial [Pseudomonas fluorescens]